MKFLVTTVLALILLQGCIKAVKNPLVPPDEAIAEIKSLGATLSTEDKPFPNNINEEFVPGDPAYINVQALSWYFSPHPDYSTLEDGNINGMPASEYVFAYEFANNESGTMVEIPSTNGFDINNPLASYPGVADIREAPEEFIVFGNYLIQAPIVRIPLTATHIEVLMGLPDGSEITVLPALPLENLKAWRDYVSPNKGR